jgi:DNA-binding NarL/FixJ family response regulator
MNRSRYDLPAGWLYPGKGGAHLTRQERRVIAALERGESNRQIARTLDLSENTVKFHMKNILKKFGVRSRMLVVIQSAHLKGHDRDIPSPDLAAVAMMGSA